MISEDTKERAADAGLLVLRAGLGLMMLINHGWSKAGQLGDDPIQFADPIGLGAAASLWLAVGAELVCAALVVVSGSRRAPPPSRS